jgi:hypothetical protein
LETQAAARLKLFDRLPDGFRIRAGHTPGVGCAN